MGGGFSLKWISDSTYELTLQVFIDCKHGMTSSDNAIYPGIFSKSTNERKFLKSIFLFSRIRIPFDTSLIHDVPFDECQEVAIYKDIIILSHPLFLLYLSSIQIPIIILLLSIIITQILITTVNINTLIRK
jgi:hypothetical protein